MYQLQDIDSTPPEIRLHYPDENPYYQEYPGRRVLCVRCLFMEENKYETIKVIIWETEIVL